MFPYDLAAADDRSLETLAGTIAHHLKRLNGVLPSTTSLQNLTPLELELLHLERRRYLPQLENKQKN